MEERIGIYTLAREGRDAAEAMRKAREKLYPCGFLRPELWPLERRRDRNNLINCIGRFDEIKRKYNHRIVTISTLKFKLPPRPQRIIYEMLGWWTDQ